MFHGYNTIANGESFQLIVSWINPFPAKGFPIDELENRLALDRVKSVSALSGHTAVNGLIGH